MTDPIIAMLALYGGLIVAPMALIGAIWYIVKECKRCDD